MVQKELSKYMTVLLDRVIQEKKFIDYTIHIEPGSQPGDGYNSEILSITVNGNSNDERFDIVCKTSKEVSSYSRFRRETLFYNKLLPILAKFQGDKNLPKADQFLSYPKCYAAVADDDLEQHIIILEDIRLQGFKMLNRTKSTPIENMRLIMREVGKFHSLSIAMKNQKPDEFTIFKQTTDIFGNDSHRLMQETFHKYFDCAIKSMRHEHHKNIMRDIKNNYVSYVKYCLNSRTSDHFLVLSHGDFWNNNILYRYNEQDTVVDVRFLDWQQARYGSLALDLLYNIFSSTDKALRDEEYENLLRIYYESLTKTVTLLGTNIDRMFTFEELEGELKRCGNFVLIMAPVLIYGSSAHQTNDLSNTLDEELKAENGQSSMAILNVEAQLEYDRRLNEVVEDILSLGYYHKIESDHRALV